MTALAEMRGEIIGIVLAGGLARRMGGGDKTLTTLAGRPILAHILERLRSQVDGLILNANGDPARFASFGVPVCADEAPDHPGPLAGVLAGMTWAARHRPAATHILTAPGDAPFPPADLAARLATPIAAGRADLTCAMSDGRRHPVIGLWPVALASDLRAALIDEGVRKVDIWTGRHRCEPVSFDIDLVDPFFNINTVDDLAQAEAALREQRAPKRPERA